MTTNSRRSTVGLLVVVAFGLLTACGDENEAPDRSGTGGGAGSGGTSGSGGSGASSGCTLNEWTITGTLGAEVVADKANGKGSAYVHGWAQTVFFDGGMVRAWGDGEHEEGATVTTDGLFFGPPGSFAAGKLLSSKAASITFLEPTAPLRLDSLGELGSCPGTPIEGSLSVCFKNGIDGTCPSALTGSLGGRDISYELNSSSYASTSEPELWRSAQATIGTNGFVLLQGGDPMSGLVLLPSMDEDPLAAYCVGTIESTSQGDAITFTLTTLSRAGGFPGTPMEGSLDFTYCRGY